MEQKYEHVWLSKKNHDLYARLNVNGKNKIVVLDKNDYLPPLFVETESNSKYRSFNHGKNLERVPIGIKKDFERTIKAFENDRRKAKDFGQTPPEMYGSRYIHHEFIRQTWDNTVDCDHDFDTLFLDIETRSKNGFPKPEIADQEVTLIQMYFSHLKKFIIFGLKDLTEEYTSEWGDIVYQKFNSETKLLQAFVGVLKRTNPSIITGFNSNGFDLPYLYFRMNNIGLDGTDLSPIGVVNSTANKFKYGEWVEEPLYGKTIDGLQYRGVEIEGVITLDYRDLVLKYGFLKIASFSLQNVAEAYKLEGKHKRKSFEYIDFDSSYSAKNINLLIQDEDKVPEDELHLWRLIKNRELLSGDEFDANEKTLEQAIFNEFFNYGFVDVELLLEIDKQAKLLNTAKTIAYICGVNLDEVSGTLKQWQNYMYNYAFKNNEILSLHQQDRVENAIYKAGFTTSKPGLHKYVVSVDAGGMYPSIFQSCNVGADTIILEKDLHPELIAMREKYFDFFTSDNFGVTGILDQKYGSETNDIPEEKEFYYKLLNSPEIGEVCKKHNVTITPNGSIYSHVKQSASSIAMEINIAARYAAKYEGIRLSGEVEKIKEEIQRRGLVI